MAVGTTASPNTPPTLGHRAVARHQHRAAFVAPADKLEAQVSGIGLERQVDQFVNDQQLGLREVSPLVLQPPLGARTRQLRP